MELLIVRVGSQVVGIPSLDVEQIVHMAEMTPLVHRDPGVLGMLNLHGDVLLVADPRVRLGIPTPPPDPDQRLILIGGPPRYFLWVDAVEALEQADSISRDLSQSEEQPLVTAAATVAGRTLPVLDCAAFRPAAALRVGEGS